MEETTILSEDVSYLQEEFPITVKDMDNIIAEFDYGLDDEGLIMKAAIKNMEKVIAEAISEDKVVFIPYIGKVRRSGYKDVLFKDREKYHQEKKKGRSSFKLFVDTVKREYCDARDAKDEHARKVNRLKKKFAKDYHYYCMNIGNAYADLFIESKLWFTEVPFDSEIQAQFDRLRDE